MKHETSQGFLSGQEILDRAFLRGDLRNTRYKPYGVYTLVQLVRCESVPESKSFDPVRDPDQSDVHGGIIARGVQPLIHALLNGTKSRKSSPSRH